MRVVVAVTVTVTVWTLIVLKFFYPLVRRTCLGVARFALRSPAHLAGFVGGLLAVPDHAHRHLTAVPAGRPASEQAGDGATVDRQVDAGDEAGVLRAEEGDDLPEVGGVAHDARRDASRQRSEVAAVELRHPVGGVHAGLHAS